MQFHKSQYARCYNITSGYGRRDIEHSASSRGNSAAVAQVSAAATFLRGIAVLASIKISMLASSTKPAVDHGATECDFVMKERILSPIEKTCLRWISRGRTVAEIASLEGKSVAFIENCLQNALVALKAKSIEEAVQKADLGQSD